MKVAFDIAHQTHIGLVRKHNEDGVGVWIPTGSSSRGPVAVVADGLGGHAAGEVASKIAVDEVLRSVRAFRGNDVSTALSAAIYSAHDIILKRSSEDAKLQGMGTTCTAAALVGSRLHLAHVGDSRAYLVRDDITQLTRDHTVAQELADESVIEAGEVEDHPASHVLTRALGMAEALEVDTPELIEAKPGDFFLLCSDGLTGQVTDEEIYDIITEYDPETACDRLIKLACNAGGPDNITVAIIRVARG